mmetsp:Transcript_7898/g.13663  ORF Transcript_7898/g.13663 Transcript_7898/m.13663 type:complete len:292 (+) Transcript_7898:239-1114(+)|eukprot:CAMPEP_0198218992 /NCGR_PEP_ID=MMETSP1445-20131203/72180_1 /TAXON_ID=36898 /ORGANISM="Pyramimonas sp., Strain CCMP2087" /LENGTH=291 /DNA_ID=CAMNT_0043896265 /DNA_START=235 /DNA_END=1110 /DNA_ORIENTATION=+
MATVNILMPWKVYGASLSSHSPASFRSRLPSVRVSGGFTSVSRGFTSVDTRERACVASRRGKALVVYASSNDDKISSEDDDAANPIMQELLVDILKIETGKENLNQYVEDESDKLRLFVEEGKGQLDEIVQQNAQRSDLEFGSALADIERQSMEVEEMIEKTRAQARAARLEDAMFEEDINRRLNASLPFKGLYNNKPKLSSEEQAFVGKEELDKLDAVTREELGKNWRVLSFGAIALALFGLSVAALGQGTSGAKVSFVVFFFVFLALGAQVLYESGKANIEFSNKKWDD